MDLSIIIVSWQAREKLKKNLLSIYQADISFLFEVFVVDNNSSDGSSEMIRKEFPQVKLITNSKNLGFSKACNQGIKQSSGKNILLLNPDMYLLKDTLKKSLEIANLNPDITVFGIKLEDEDGNLVLQARRFPKLFDQLMIVLKIHHLFPKVLDKYLNKNFDYEKSSVVDSIRGSYFFINKISWQKISQKDWPLLDERFFLWFEEVDFCKQVYKNGGKLRYFPQAKAIDSVGYSFSQLNTKKKQVYFRNSMLAYFKKWHSIFAYLILKIAWFFVMIFLIFKKD
jgi:GT2 family glycosyltransferase